MHLSPAALDALDPVAERQCAEWDHDTASGMERAIRLRA
jgi:hypothetical protein